jgi:hypothetical protein
MRHDPTGDRLRPDAHHVGRPTRSLALTAAALAALCLVGSATVPAQRASTPPVARAARWSLLNLTPPNLEARDPDLAAVRDRLRTAIAARDLAGVRALFAPMVRDQDAAVPAADILATMGPLAAGSPMSDEWEAFDAALRLGGVRLGDAYVVPFMAAAVTGRANAAVEVFVAGRDTPVRDAPAGAAAILTRVSNAILRAALAPDVETRADASGCRSWTAVENTAGTVGWVCAADTRPMVGLYYAFERLDDGWRLTALWAVDVSP